MNDLAGRSAELVYVPIACVALQRLVQESLALWGVAGEAAAEPASNVLRVQAPGGLAVRIEPSAEPSFRWYVRWRQGEAGSAVERTRPCGSLLGVLAALRRALAVERGSPIRIAPQADRQKNDENEK